MPNPFNDGQKFALLIDTNVIVNDWLLSRPAGTHIRNQSTYGPLSLLVPELVIQEAVGVYRRTLKASQKNLREALLRRRRLDVGAPDPVLAQVNIDVDVGAAASAYESRLRAVLKSARATVLPLPTVSHERVVQRALERRKPFDQEGRAGYRDALIWHCLLEVAPATDKLVLVTADSGDFARSRNEPELLADALADEVQALAESHDREIAVVLRTNLSAVIEHDLPAEHAALVELRQRLRSDRSFYKAVYRQLDDSVNQAYADVDLEPDLDVEWDDLEIDFVNDLHDFDVVGVAAGDAAPLFLQIIGHADVQFQVEVSASAAFDERGSPIRHDIEWNEYTERGRLTDVLPAELSYQALYAPGNDSLSKVELVTIAENWDWIEDGHMHGGSVTPPERLP